MIEIVRQIRVRMKEAQDRQKSYADVRRTDLQFQTGDKVFLKVSPSKGKVILVEWHEEGYRGICGALLSLPTGEGLTSTTVW